MDFSNWALLETPTLNVLSGELIDGDDSAATVEPHVVPGEADFDLPVAEGCSVFDRAASKSSRR